MRNGQKFVAKSVGNGKKFDQHLSIQYIVSQYRNSEMAIILINILAVNVLIY